MTSDQSPTSQEFINATGQRSDSFLTPPPPAATPQLPIHPDNPPWAQPAIFGALKALLTWVGSVFFLLAIPVVLVIPYFVYLAVNAAMPEPDALMRDKAFLFLSILGVIPAHLLTFFIAYLVITNGRQYSFSKTLGLEWPRSVNAWAGVGLCVLIAGFLLLVGSLITWFFGGDKKTDLDLIIESSFAARLVTVLLAVGTAPIVEEVIYRGVLYPAFARLVRPVFAIILVSLLFAGVHFYQYRNNLAVIAVITILSASLTTVRAVTHRLLPSFVIHLVFNGLQSIMILLQGVTKTEPVTPQPPPVPGLAFIQPFLDLL